VQDYKFSNGVIGKMIVYDMEERQARQDRRLRRIEESRAVEDRRRAEEAEPADRAGLVHRQGLIRKVAGVVRGMYARRATEYVEVKPESQARERGDQDGQPDFHITEGPKVNDSRGSTSRATKRSRTASWAPR